MALFESRHEKLVSRSRFLWRLTGSTAVGLGLLAAALGIGVCGYHFIGNLPWVDALLNASMILSGMGPTDPLPNDAAKLFASAYAIFSGVVFITVMAIILSPAVHRVMHRFHIEEDTD